MRLQQTILVSSWVNPAYTQSAINSQWAVIWLCDMLITFFCRYLCEEVAILSMCNKMLHLVAILLLLPQIDSASFRQDSSTRRHKPKERHQTVYTSLPLNPSVVMVPLDIQETVNKDLDPTDIDEFELLTIMGSDYDRQYMSFREPADLKTHPNGTLVYKFKDNQTPAEGQMPGELTALEERSIRLAEDGPELRIKFNRRTKKKLQRFLWAYSYCPVRYKWKQLSTRFWPRWIKTGECENKRSCSIPVGMTCQPSKMSNIKLLRYYCPSSKRTCQWIKIEYPILVQCSCGCQSYGDYWQEITSQHNVMLSFITIFPS